MTDKPQDPDRPFPPPLPVDKTVVEDLSDTTTFTPLAPGTRASAKKLTDTNPYLQALPQYYPELPNGKDPEWLGSGTVAGILGDGGMARVYKIWSKDLEVFRAVKILLPGQPESQRVRFETEAKITAKLRHANIAEVHAVGQYHKLPYMEMEMVEGSSLEALIGRYGRLPDALSSAIGIFVARALVYAHSQEVLLYGKTYRGIIHRDLKPANVMIASDGRVKLMDFGIARPAETGLHTAEGSIVGTLPYLSPEQLDGDDVDHRTDIYSLGAILYEMLTGTKTFPQSTVTNLMKKKSTGEYRTFGEFDFAVPPALGRIARKCLELRREDRFADAQSLLDALTKAHEALTPLLPEEVMRSFRADPKAHLVSRRTHLLPWLRKRSVLVALIASVLTIAVAVLIARLLLRGQASNAPALSAAETPAASATMPTASAAEATRPAAAMSPSSAVDTALAPLPAQPKPRPPTAAELLHHAYGKTDLLSIARIALARGNSHDAILALELTPATNPQYALRNLLLLDQYIQANRLADATKLAGKMSVDDGQYELLIGRLADLQGQARRALDHYQSAIVKASSVRDIKDVRSDALYYTARIYTAQCEASPSAEARAQALNAWLSLKRLHAADPTSERFREANAAMASIK